MTAVHPGTAHPGTVDAATNPHLSGVFAPVVEEVDLRDLRVEGRLPEEMDGTYLRNGPNPRFTPVGSYIYPLDGDAMMHRVRVRDGRADYSNRFVRTPALVTEEKAGRALWGGIMDPPPDADTVGPQLAGLVATCRTSTWSGTAASCWPWPSRTTRSASVPTCRPWAARPSRATCRWGSRRTQKMRVVTSIPPTSLSPGPPRILVVDDEPALRDVLEITFRRAGLRGRHRARRARRARGDPAAPAALPARAHRSGDARRLGHRRARRRQGAQRGDRGDRDDRALDRRGGASRRCAAAPTTSSPSRSRPAELAALAAQGAREELDRRREPAPPRADRAPRARRPRLLRRQPGDAAGRRARRQGRLDAHHRAASPARAAPARSASRARSTTRSDRAGKPVPGRQLRRAARGADGERALRPREGRLHRRRARARSASSARPTAARCSSTRSASCPRRCR